MWGKWRTKETCPENSFAYKFSLKVEPHTLGDGKAKGTDDTALNGVKLYCKQRGGKEQGRAKSRAGIFGSWTEPKSCSNENDFFVGYRFQAETSGTATVTGAVDSWYAENIDLICEGGENLNGREQWPTLENGGEWASGGLWSSETSCSPGEAICGL